MQSRSQSVRAAGADAAVSQSGPQVQSQLVSQGRSQSASQQVQTQQSPQILATQEPRSKFVSFCMQSALRHPVTEEATRRRPSIDESQATADASQASFCIEQLDAAEGRAQALRRRTRDVCDGAVVASLPPACEWTSNAVA